MKKGPPADPSSITSYAKTKGLNRNTVRRKLRQAGIEGPIDAEETDRILAEQTPARYKTIDDETKGLSYNEWEKRHKAAKARQEEIKLQQIEGTLVLRADVEKAVFAQHRRVRDSMQNVAARISGLVAAETSQEQCFAIITRELTQILSELSA
jgi:predicted NAD-dependent protein-ADP-ribosyltransferase YbiA (DUF1768 family)